LLEEDGVGFHLEDVDVSIAPPLPLSKSLPSAAIGNAVYHNGVKALVSGPFCFDAVMLCL